MGEDSEQESTRGVLALAIDQQDIAELVRQGEVEFTIDEPVIHNGIRIVLEYNGDSNG